MHEPSQSISRRHALKVLAAATGASALTLLPAKWVKPKVGIGALPAFAQASLGTGDFQTTLTWDTGVPVGSENWEEMTDVDLHVIEPDGTHVYFANRIGLTATLDFDNTYGFGPENIYVPPGQSAAGTYQVFIVYWYGLVTTQATIRVRVFANSSNEHSRTFHRTLRQANPSVSIDVAEVSFPSGTITEVTSTHPVPAHTQLTK